MSPKQPVFSPPFRRAVPDMVARAHEFFAWCDRNVETLLFLPEDRSFSQDRLGTNATVNATKRKTAFLQGCDGHERARSWADAVSGFRPYGSSLLL
jgi:hypothetical protein